MNHHPATLAAAALLLAATAATSPAVPPIITNVKASQRAGTKLVDITYDAADTDGDTLTIRIEVSDNDGARYSVPAFTLTGDIGEGIVPGTGKHIVWNAGTDWNGEYSDLMRVMVYAIDSQGCPGLEWGDEVPPGGFLLGQDGGAEGSGPSCHVNIPWSYWLSKYEITAQQYCDFLNTAFAAGRVALKDFSAVYSIRGSTYTNFSGSYLLCNVGDARKIRWNVNNFEVVSNYHRYPADVTWFGAMAFAQFYGYDLPTEAEWEKAARGPDHDAQDEHCLYSWGNDKVNAKANFAYDPSNPATQRPTGFYDGNQTPTGPDMANGYALYDMTGNASEWTRTRTGNYSSYMSLAGSTNKSAAGIETYAEAWGTLPAGKMSTNGLVNHPPIVPKAFLIKIEDGVILVDDGSGNLKGSGSGHINYKDGSWDMSLSDLQHADYARDILLLYASGTPSEIPETYLTVSTQESGGILASCSLVAGGMVQHNQIVPGSFAIRIGNEVFLYDDGDGGLHGNGAKTTGTISYVGGTWYFKLDDTRNSEVARPITITYAYYESNSISGIYPSEENLSDACHNYWTSPTTFFFKTGAPIFSNSIPSATDSDAGFRVIRRYIPDASDD